MTAVDFGTATTLIEILSVSAGVGHTCVILNDLTASGVVQFGVVRCWGTDGTQVSSDPTNPFALSVFTSYMDITYLSTSGQHVPLMGVSEISAGFFATCALLNNARVECEESVVCSCLLRFF